jgi:hypothetical protein
MDSPGRAVDSENDIDAEPEQKTSSLTGKHT